MKMTVRDLKRVLEGLDEDMQVITEVEENFAGVSSIYTKNLHVRLDDCPPFLMKNSGFIETVTKYDEWSNKVFPKMRKRDIAPDQTYKIPAPPVPKVCVITNRIGVKR